MLERGIFYAQRGYMSLSLATRDQDKEAFLEAFADVLDRHAELFAAMS